MSDLTLITNVLLADGIGRHGIYVIKMLQDNLNINCLLQQPILFNGITDPKLISTFQKPIQKSNVSFWVYILGLNDQIIPTHASLQSPIKIAYSMIESTAIPKLWVNILNNFYDMVVVPNTFLINVYKNSGVTIPIFVLPLGMLIDEDYYNYQHKQNEIFTFGMTGSFLNKKNHIKTMHAFLAAFKNKKDVKLKLHGRFGSYKEQVYNEYKKLGSPKNIELTSGPMNDSEYRTFMKSIDCVVLISKGEGISLIPRENLALGKPTIITNAHAHKQLCDTGFFIPVKAEIKEPAYYEVFNQTLGSYFDCKTEDVTKAMKEVYNNYPKYFKIAQENRNWVKQFSLDTLRPKYISLLKPTKIIRGDKNEITDEHIQIQDEKLYNKYVEVFGVNK